MDLFEVLCPLFLLVTLSSANNEVCPAPQRTALNLSIISRRNTTGHWVVAVDTTSADYKRSTGRRSPKELSVTVGQEAASCNDSETVRLTVTTEVSSSVDITVPSGYEVINSLGYYKMYTTLATWAQAREKCIEDGAHLLVINSNEESDVPRTFFGRNPTIPGATWGGIAYIGFHDRYKEGEYITVLGELLDRTGYTSWDNDQPSRHAEENCGLATKNGKLHDGYCSVSLPFICEYNPSYKPRL